MAENKKNNSSSNTAKSKNNKGKSTVKRVGKDKNVQLTFYDSHRNAIMLAYLAVSVFMFFVVIIQGYNLWQKFRSALFALLGLGFILVVAELIIITVKMCLKNTKKSLLMTNLSMFLLTAFFCAILHILNFNVSSGGFEEWKLQFFEACKSGWNIGMGIFDFSGGILGAIFGGIPLHLFGKNGSLVVLIILFFASLLFYLNADINAIGEKISLLALSSKDKLSQSNENRKARNAEKKQIREEERLAKLQHELDSQENAEKVRITEKKDTASQLSIDQFSSIKSSEATDSSTEKSEKKSEKAVSTAFNSDSFDFNETEIEYDPINKNKVVFSQPKKHFYPSNGIFTYSDEVDESKPKEKSVSNSFNEKTDTELGSDLISMGGGSYKAHVKINNILPDNYEEIDDGDFEQNSVETKETEQVPTVQADTSISDNDKAIVHQAIRDAESKINKNKDEVTNYKERTPQKVYRLPSIEFLKKPTFGSDSDSETEMRLTAKKLVDILKSFGVETTLIGASRGPSVTRYELSPAPGVKISRITSLADDIALGLASTDVRIEAPIPNKSAVGIEVPNRKSSMVTLREIISSKEYKESQDKLLTVALGKDIAGNIRCTDLAKMPHLLIAGTTGSGKSVCLNCMIASILYNATPDQVKLLMIDPKQVEFSVYNGIPHLLVPVITDARKAAGSLAWAVGEMDSRYKSFSTCGVRDIKSYNNYIKDHPELPFMPQIVIFIDELNDLMMVSPKEVEDSICRLAQKARAAGMHLVVATQRPSVDVITGIIKANIPSRLSLAVSSQVDSRTILDSVGAEKLLGNGDMLFNPVGVSKPVRIQGAYLSDSEIEKIVTFIKDQSSVSYDDEIMEKIEKNATAEKKKGGGAVSSDSDDNKLDALIEDAMNIITELNSASTTVIQRKLSVGYARAARIMDQLEQLGYVSAAEGNKPRKVLLTRAQFLEMRANGEQADDDYDVLSD